MRNYLPGYTASYTRRQSSVRAIVRIEEVTACLDRDTLRPGPYSHREIREYNLDGYR
jgi:hypothetical protein